MLDLLVRTGLAALYLSVAALAFWNLRNGAVRLVARRVSTAALGVIALLWAIQWGYFAIKLGHIGGSTHLDVAIWVSRMIHFPQLAAIFFMLSTIVAAETK